MQRPARESVPCKAAVTPMICSWTAHGSLFTSVVAPELLTFGESAAQLTFNSQASRRSPAPVLHYSHRSKIASISRSEETHLNRLLSGFSAHHHKNSTFLDRIPWRCRPTFSLLPSE